jgi:K+-transporting ATPase ATPase A chain
MMGHMTPNGWIQIAIYAGLVILLTKPLGDYMTRVFNGERAWIPPGTAPGRSCIYRIRGVNETKEQYRVTYAAAMLAFSFAGFVILYGLQRLP